MAIVKLLFVEDEPETVQQVITHLEMTGGGYAPTVRGFATARDDIESVLPDVVVLDLLQGGSSAEPDVPGVDLYKWIWEKRFCPIIVYSARPDLLSENVSTHPFVKYVQKGSGSPERVKIALQDFQPHIGALNQAERHIRQQFATSMRDVAPYAFGVFPSTMSSERDEMILRGGRRRLAALMDELTRDNQSLASWEQYLFPPVSDQLQLGDIIQEKNGKENNHPEAFRVVLTPSCDLVATEKRKPKVANVLVACCVDIKRGLQIAGVGTSDAKTLKDNLEKTVLSQGYFRAALPLPSLPNQIPCMFADLRKLELISFDDVRSKYRRIASCDSPFREVVAWAYMQIACRPGLPERDLKSWCEEICSGAE